MAYTSQQLEDQFAAARAARKPLSELRSGIENQLGVGQSRQNVQDISKNIYETNKLLKNVEGDIKSRAVQLGGPVTEAVRRRLTTTARSPLEQTVNELGQNLGIEQQGLGFLENQAGQQLQDILQSNFNEDDIFTERIKRQMQREAEARQAALAEKQLRQQRELAALQSRANQGIDVNAILAALKDKYPTTISRSSVVPQTIATGGLYATPKASTSNTSNTAKSIFNNLTSKGILGLFR